MQGRILCTASTILMLASVAEAQVDGEASVDTVVNHVLAYSESGSGRTAIDEVELAVGGRVPLHRRSEERLYYFLGGRGIVSIYEEAPQGDVYEVHQDLAIYMTPGIEHEIVNVGNTPLRYAVFMVTGGVMPEGDLSWSAVTQRGVTIENPVVGSGLAVTDVFDEGLNPSKSEGLHLEIHDIWLRRPQKFTNAEVVTIAPGRSIRPHTHHDTGETYYILYGEGHFVWDNDRIPCTAGSSMSYPVGVRRAVVNTGQYPMSYVVMSATVN